MGGDCSEVISTLVKTAVRSEARVGKSVDDRSEKGRPLSLPPCCRVWWITSHARVRLAFPSVTTGNMQVSLLLFENEDGAFPQHLWHTNCMLS